MNAKLVDVLFVYKSDLLDQNTNKPNIEIVKADFNWSTQYSIQEFDLVIFEDHYIIKNNGTI